MAEATLVRACRRELARRRIFRFNLGPANGATGLPDDMCFPYGTTLPIEYKDGEDGELSPRQVYIHECFAAAGAPVLVVRRVGDLRTRLDELERRKEAKCT